MEHGNVAEAEIKMFWKLRGLLTWAAASGEDLTDYVDELDVLREMTDSPTLKERCTKAIDEFTADQARKVRV